jgi:hypothetical protein
VAAPMVKAVARFSRSPCTVQPSPDLDQTQRVSLLDELDARQDEVLAQLEDLNARLEQVLAAWTSKPTTLAKAA